MPERMTAKKVRIADLVNGEWVQQDGMEPSYVTSKSGERVSRARILATIVSKFMSDDGNFGSLTIDDGTDTLRAKSFKDLSILEKAEIGQLVDLIGKIREYNGEIYMMPEIIKPIADPNQLLLRQLELKKRMKEAGSVDNSENRGSKKESSEAESINEKDALRKKIIEIIETSKEGMDYSELIEKSSQTEAKVDSVVNDLLSEGICYEPTPGKIKKI